jgi:hypothetical protein
VKELDSYLNDHLAGSVGALEPNGDRWGKTFVAHITHGEIAAAERI